MRIKFYCLFGLTIFYSDLLMAQIGDLVVTPPSPEASSLTKVSNYPDATYSGIPDISIPLFDYTGNSLNYSIGLSYNSQGMRVNEEASAVGLGWALNATGVISREVMYKDDLAPDGFYKHDPDDFVPDGRDSSPDIFSFNLMGKSGKFLLNYDPSSPGNYKVVFLNQVPIKIELVNTDFIITDDSGIIYTFNVKENTKKEYSQQGETEITQSNYISSWFLSSIKSPVGDEITFQYNHSANPSLQRKTVSKYVTATLTSYAGGGCWPYNYVGNASLTTITTTIDQILLSQVNFPNGNIQFLTNSRIDLDFEGSNVPLKYNKILIQSNAVGFYKEIEFKHSYFYSGSGSADKLSKRLQLQGLLEKSNLSSVKSYSLIYNSLNLPDKDSESKDYWGFYNGQGSYYYNKEPSPIHVQSNLLSAIVHPTGAKTIYTFESNDYNNFSSSLMDENPPNSPYGGKIGPGCRIVKIEQLDHLENSLGFKEYRYFDGKRMNGSKYSQISNFLDPFNPNCNTPVTYESQMSQSNFSTSIGPGGYEIGYGQVREVFSNVTDNGRKDYYYYNDAIISQGLQGVPNYVENRNGYLAKYVVYKKSGANYLPVEERIDSVAISSNINVNANIILPTYINFNGTTSYDTTYTVNSNWKYIKRTQINKFDEQGSQKESLISDYYYDNSTHKQLTRKSEDLSDYRKKWQFYQYPHDYSTGNSTINLLKSNNILNVVVEEISAVSSLNTYLITGGRSSEFNSGGKGLKDMEYELEVGGPIPSSSFKFSSRAIGNVFPSGSVGNYAKDSKFKLRVVYNSYINNRLSMFTKNGYSVSSVKWGYGNEYPILFASNVSQSNVSYTSFESGDNLNWSYSEANTSTGDSKTGKKYYNLGSAAITKSGFGGSSLNVFKLTFWAKRTSSGPTSWNILGSLVSLSDTEWRLVQREVATNSFTISGSGVLIDELRLHPISSNLNTYTYFPMQGISSYTDSNNRTFYYEYDSLGRLISIKDDEGYLKEVVEYEYMFSN